MYVCIYIYIYKITLQSTALFQMKDVIRKTCRIRSRNRKRVIGKEQK